MYNEKRRASNLSRKFRTNCPFKIAKNLGYSIRYMDLPFNVKGYCQRSFRRKFIVMNQSLPEEEQAFICAHELAHLLLHNGFNHYFITNKTSFVIGRYEKEANRFAIHLLTSGQHMEPDESHSWFLIRCGIPTKFHILY